jgi:hypothetical protein
VGSEWRRAEAATRFSTFQVRFCNMIEEKLDVASQSFHAGRIRQDIGKLDLASILTSVHPA